MSRNNLYISASGKSRKTPLWLALYYKNTNPAYVLPPNYEPNWMTDVDYDGFDWDGAEPPFVWHNSSQRFADLQSFAQTVGIERHGLRLRKEEIFEDYNLPVEPGPVAQPTLRLKPGCSAIDVGAVLPNINDDFVGRAPDLGAYEYGRPLPAYGPRLSR